MSKLLMALVAGAFALTASAQSPAPVGSGEGGYRHPECGSNAGGRSCADGRVVQGRGVVEADCEVEEVQDQEEGSQAHCQRGRRHGTQTREVTVPARQSSPVPAPGCKMVESCYDSKALTNSIGSSHGY